ncbi:MAG: type II secretion system protein [Candidatus Paceibacterota bacterium]|jgi:prepilin-type N-terminal cleavage/methylation domain-containing protein
MKKNKGFTLIELLVVIAIIGILSSVVLASLNTARDKGNDAAVKSNLTTVRTQAELWYDDHTNSYTGMCEADPILGAINAARTSGGNDATCVVATDGNSWGAEAQLKASTNFYCVDSTGKSTTTAATSGLAAATPLCD